MGKGGLSSKRCWENGQLQFKLDYSLILCTKMNSKWIENLNIRPEIIKLLEEVFHRQ